MKTLAQQCLDHGLRMTDARQAIVDAIEDSDDHPDAETLLQRARDREPSVAMATVYRLLRAMEAEGLIEKHDFRGGRARYEDARTKQHDHLIDLESGAVIEFRDQELEAIKARIAERLGYTLRDHRLELYGEKKQS